MMDNGIFANEPQSFIRFFLKSFELSFYAFKKTIPLCFVGGILFAGMNIVFGPSVMSYIKTLSGGEHFFAEDIFFIMQRYWLDVLIYLALCFVGLIFNMIYITQINSKFCNEKLSIKHSFLIARKNFFSYMIPVIVSSILPFLLVIVTFWESSMELSVVYWILVFLMPFIVTLIIFTQYLILLEEKKVFEAFFASWHLVPVKYFFRILMTCTVIGSINIINQLFNGSGLSNMILFFVTQMLSIPVYQSFFLNMFYDFKLRRLMPPSKEPPLI